MRIRRFPALLAGLVTLAGTFAPCAHASEAWEVLESPHFSVHYYPGEEVTARRVAAYAEEALPRLEHDFGIGDGPKIPVIIDQASFFNGEAEPIKDRIHIDPLLAASSVIGTKRFISHELTHVITFRALSQGSEISKLTNLAGLPSWFLEGLAQYEGEYWYSDNDRMLRLATLDHKLMTDSERDHFQLFGVYGGAAGYNEGYSLTAYIFDTYGRDKLAKLFTVLRSGKAGSLSLALKQTVGKTLPELQAEWKAKIIAHYEQETRGQAADPSGATAVVESQDGAVNVAPALSPDGHHLAYLTSLHQAGFMYLRGQVLGLLTLVVANPDGSDARRIPSEANRIASFSWSPDGKSLVLSAIALGPDGKPSFQLFHYDLASGAATPLPAVEGAAEWPAWQPAASGREAQIAFVEIVDGKSRLMLYDPSQGKSQAVPARLQDLELADLAWSPDGKQLAARAYLPGNGGKIVLIDPLSGAITPLTRGSDRTADMSPTWTPDGKALVFASDRDGSDNLYRLTLDGQLSQLTHAYAGLDRPWVEPDGSVLFMSHDAEGSDLMRFKPGTGAPLAYSRPAPSSLDRTLVLMPDPPEALPSAQAKLAKGKVAARLAEDRATGNAPDPLARNTLASQNPAAWPSHPYHSVMTNDVFMPEITQDEAGEAVGGMTMYSDILDKQQLSLDAKFGLMSQRFSYMASYVNHMWDLPWAITVFDVPNVGIAEHVDPTDLYGSLYWERQRGVSLGTQIPLVAGQSLQANLSISYLSTLGDNLGWSLFGAPLPQPDLADVRTGQLDTVSLGWQDVHIAPSEDEDANPAGGYAAMVGYQLSDHAIGSAFDYSQLGVVFDRYFPIIPSLGQNLALTLHGESAVGDQVPLFLGGVMGGGPFVPLRGYNAATFTGSKLVVGSLDYTAPLDSNIDLQLGPIYLNRLYLDTFASTGDAWNPGDNFQFHSSLGAEIKLRTSFMGQQIVDFRFGVAHPIGPGQGLDWYVAF